jgi:hypothetical protein
MEMKEIKSNNSFINADLTGSLTAFTCAVHCSVAPLISSFGILNIEHSHHHAFDWTMLSIGVIIALYSILKDYLKSHKNILPLAISVLGFVFLSIGISSHQEGIAILSVMGGLAIMISHFINYKLKHNHAYC